jgi:FkbM family methyltransferase
MAPTSLPAAPRPPFRSHGQNLEDIVLWRALGHVRNGRYIDVGACDPRFLSISRGFYEQGWRGVHFEPLPDFAARLRADRPDEPVHEIALADRCGEIDFHRSPIEGLSTGVAAHAGSDTVAMRVPVRTLASFGSGWAGDEVHWMKIDVEGMEGDVLRGWDPQLLRPWILVIEATRPNSPEPCHAEWEPVVLAAGYRFALFDGLNRFYVADERRELLPVVAAPANVFDLMAGCRPEGWRSFIEPPPWQGILARIVRRLRRGLAAWMSRHGK